MILREKTVRRSLPEMALHDLHRECNVLHRGKRKAIAVRMAARCLTSRLPGNPTCGRHLSCAEHAVASKPTRNIWYVLRRPSGVASLFPENGDGERVVDVRAPAASLSRLLVTSSTSGLQSQNLFVTRPSTIRIGPRDADDVQHRPGSGEDAVGGAPTSGRLLGFSSSAKGDGIVDGRISLAAEFGLGPRLRCTLRRRSRSLSSLGQLVCLGISQ